MTEGPGFDPHEILGVTRDADAVVIQLAYRARIRDAHPDVAGAAGLEHAKVLNVARDWLLDPVKRAQLPQPRPAEARPRTPSSRRRATTHGRLVFDPETDDFGPRTQQLRAFLHSIGTLGPDERARANYSLGDQRPVRFEEYRDFLEPGLWRQSQALHHAVASAWERGVDDIPPTVAPLGRLVPTGALVANAYAQWILLAEFFRRELANAVFRSTNVIDSFAARCEEPWLASVRQPRYGPNEPAVVQLMRMAASLPLDAAERLATSWRKHLGRDGLGHASDTIGPGVWLPAPPNYPEVLKVSGYLAAVDASRIEPPDGLDPALHGGFRNALRISAHVTALGMGGRSGRAYLRPWHEAVDADRSIWSRLRARMPAS